MPFIEQLLNGEDVEWKKLGEVITIEKGKQLNKSLLTESGEYPAYNGGVTYSGFTDKYNYSENKIIISQGGASAGFVNFITTKFYANAHCYVVLPNISKVDNKYVYHLLKMNQENLMGKQLGAGIPALHTANILGISIPIPCPDNPTKSLDIQHKIVEILDKFTELEAELDCRKRQYEYYRNQLLSFDMLNRGGQKLNDVKTMTLGDLGTFVRGSGLQKKDLTTQGIPAIHYGQIYTYYGTYAKKTKSFVTKEIAEKLKKVNYGDVIITNTSENIEDVCKAVVYLLKEQGVTGGHASIFKPSEKIIGKYLAYYTQTTDFAIEKRKFAKGTKVIDVNAKDLAKIKIPLPPLFVQSEIVEILDKFDTLCNSISEGLPKEIELRRKQYEYYRNQLLTFAQ